MALRLLDLSQFLRVEHVILIDCEFTCWEDSLSTWWADAAKPPETIEIDLARFDVRAHRVGETFRSFVRPERQRRLSSYCRRLLAIPQEAIDGAPPLPVVLEQVRSWVSAHAPASAPTCGWGTMDRDFLSADAARAGWACPLDPRPHVDVHGLCDAVLDGGPAPRDAVRARYGLAPNRERHRALADALDIAQFCALLRRTLGG